jgi:DNA-directed RNA polymerase specialized sigma24 family protein
LQTEQRSGGRAARSARRVIAKLTRRERDALFLVATRNLSYSEAASAMALSVQEFTAALLAARSKMIEGCPVGGAQQQPTVLVNIPFSGRLVER